MQEKPTNELDELLKSMSPGRIDSYIKENQAYMAEGRKAFYYYMKNVLDAKGKRLMDIYSLAGVSETYGSKIITMEKHTTNRDLIIRFCVAGHFSVDETNRALKLYGMNQLYSKDVRDVCLIVAINNRRYNLADIDDMLTQRGLNRLSKEE